MNLKKIARRQARAWLFPLRNLLNELSTGEIDSVRGYPITQIGRTQSDVARADHLLAGFVGMADRLWPELDTRSLEKLAKKLSLGALLKRDELAQCRIVADQMEITLIA